MRRHRSHCETHPCSRHHTIPAANRWLLTRAGRPLFFTTALSLGSSMACNNNVSINAAGVSISGNFRCPGVSYDIGRSPFSWSKLLLKKIVLSFFFFCNPLPQLVGVGGVGMRRGGDACVALVLLL